MTETAMLIMELKRAQALIQPSYQTDHHMADARWRRFDSTSYNIILALEENIFGLSLML